METRHRELQKSVRADNKRSLHKCTSCDIPLKIRVFEHKLISCVYCTATVPYICNAVSTSAAQKIQQTCAVELKTTKVGLCVSKRKNCASVCTFERLLVTVTTRENGCTGCNIVCKCRITHQQFVTCEFNLHGSTRYRSYTKM